MDLKKYYGIGIKTEKQLKNIFGINERINGASCNLSKLLKEQITLDISQNILTNRDLYDYVRNNIGYYKEINCYRGIRHKNKYPVRGQRTHTNASKKNYRYKHFI
jgi:small subunit ribosomal protein S13